MAGIITTANNYKNVLRETDRDIFGNPTWRQAYTNIELQQQKAEAQVNRQFGEAIGKAYEAANAQAANIAGSALGEGYKDMLLSENQATLNAAYDQYMANLAEAQNTVSQTYGEAKTQLDEMLKERAENMKALETEYGKYWTATDKWFSENLSPEDYAKQAADSDWSPFYKYDSATNTYAAKTYEELMQPTYDSEKGEWVSIYDADGNITDVGRDFFDIMTNYYAQQVATDDQALPQSFAQYLAGENAELYEWASGYDPYSWSPVMTAEGEFLSTNIGRFKQLMGLESNDQTYRYIERLTGVKKEKIDKTLNELIGAGISYVGTGHHPIADVTPEAMEANFKKLGQLASEMGVGGTDWAYVEKTANRLIDEYKATGQAVTDAVWITALAIAIQGGMVVASGAMGGAPAAVATGIPASISGGKMVGDTSMMLDELNYMMNASDEQLEELYLNSVLMMATAIYKNDPSKQAVYKTTIEDTLKNLMYRTHETGGPWSPGFGHTGTPIYYGV